jgi:uncharacterized protein (DUF2384 family)
VLARIIELLDELVSPTDRQAFLEQPHPLLLGMRPIDMLATQEGFEAVESLLEGVASGGFA